MAHHLIFLCSAPLLLLCWSRICEDLTGPYVHSCTLITYLSYLSSFDVQDKDAYLRRDLLIDIMLCISVGKHACCGGCINSRFELKGHTTRSCFIIEFHVLSSHWRVWLHSIECIRLVNTVCARAVRHCPCPARPMALVSQRLSSKPPLEPWHQACNRFLEGLTDEEAKTFWSATLINGSLEDLVNDTSKAHKESCTSIRHVKSFRKIRPFVEILAEYGSAVDVYANASSLYLCPIWGSRMLALIWIKGNGNTKSHHSENTYSGVFSNICV